jgi:hypothetical protein
MAEVRFPDIPLYEGWGAPLRPAPNPSGSPPELTRELSGAKG